MKLQRFNQFITENQDDDDLKQLADLGLYIPPAEIVYQKLVQETGLEDFMTLEGDSIRFRYDWSIDAEGQFNFDKHDIRRLGIERDFFGLIDIVLDFDKMMITADSDVNQKDLDFNDSCSEEGPMSDYVTVLDDYYGKESTGPVSTQELADDIVMMFQVWDHQEDPFGIWASINEIIENEISDRLEKFNEEEDDDDDNDDEDDDDDNDEDDYEDDDEN
ncbi:hypothetical protein UFOVP1604_88 [uncultured Caudovirales phage]|uniref:Uncharacterized protein n=1 Tax=uncultured Caudovirales phage TaxID=2100421 RepID=A0A6J5SUJ9_9CAUD|nr:hypothetical protein UFOVP1604_88 [uncultured Caudovirales phage]